MSVAITSINAYHDLRDSGDMTNQQRRIMASIVKGRGYTRSELADLTGLPINCVTGRVNELLKADKLEEDISTRKCSITGRTAKTVRRPEADGA